MNERDVVHALAKVDPAAAAARRRETRVEVTVRVVPMDPSKPIGESTHRLLFTQGQDPREHEESVKLTARLAYLEAMNPK